MVVNKVSHTKLRQNQDFPPCMKVDQGVPPLGKVTVGNRYSHPQPSAGLRSWSSAEEKEKESYEQGVVKLTMGKRTETADLS